MINIAICENCFTVHNNRLELCMDKLYVDEAFNPDTCYHIAQDNYSIDFRQEEPSIRNGVVGRKYCVHKIKAVLTLFIIVITSPPLYHDNIRMCCKKTLVFVFFFLFYEFYLSSLLCPFQYQNPT